MIEYRCPVCGCHDNLHVDVTTCARLDQGDDFDPDPVVDAELEWGHYSTMHCLACRHIGLVANFELGEG